MNGYIKTIGHSNENNLLQESTEQYEVKNNGLDELLSNDLLSN